VIGRVVGKYKILAQIGEGGMGTVYRAEHVVLGSPAAIKLLLPQYTQDASVVDRFFTEAKAASAIRHVGIVEVFDYGRLPEGTAFIAMELLRGESLAGFIGRHRRLEPVIAQIIMLQILAALSAAHVVGVIHRDLKPDNIFLTRDTGAPGGIRVKILDFGVAKLITDVVGPPTKTKGNTILGTPTYMAPEQCRGGGEIDARADLYATGCILYEMLIGVPPFVGEGGGEVMAKHIYEPAPRLMDVAPQLPAELDLLVAKMLAKSPAERTPSAGWALAALERIALGDLAGVEIPLATIDASIIALPALPAADATGAEADDRRRRMVPIAVVAIAIVIALAAIFLIGRSGDPDLPPTHSAPHHGS
jgi:serine/threonine-protein kinase